jgi:type II restriction/modification system DNA methylase subunit YeeA
LSNKLNDNNIEESNKIIDDIKICDMSVGSGHFLASRLNEIISLKFELGILVDKRGRRLKNYTLSVDNDELLIFNEDGRLFEYKVVNNRIQPEMQRIQETIFFEKKKIIENCLFGVDINPNSVKICRLRLWIELLKNSFYKVESNNNRVFLKTKC